MDGKFNRSQLEIMNYKDLQRLSRQYNVFQQGVKKVTLIDRLRRILDAQPSEERNKTSPHKQNRLFKKKRYFSKPSFCKSPLKMTLRSRMTLRSDFQNISPEQLPIVDSPEVSTINKVEGAFCQDTFNILKVLRNSHCQGVDFSNKEDISAEHLTLVGSSFTMDSKCIIPNESISEEKIDKYTFSEDIMANIYNTGTKSPLDALKKYISLEHSSPHNTTFTKDPETMDTEKHMEESNYKDTSDISPLIKNNFYMDAESVPPRKVPQLKYQSSNYKWNVQSSSKQPDMFRFTPAESVAMKPFQNSKLSCQETSNVSSHITTTGPTDAESVPTRKVPQLKYQSSSKQPNVFRFTPAESVAMKPFQNSKLSCQETSNVSSHITTTGPTGTVRSLIPVRVLRQKQKVLTINNIRKVAKATGVLKERVPPASNMYKHENKKSLKGVRSNRRFELQMKFRQMHQ